MSAPDPRTGRPSDDPLSVGLDRSAAGQSDDSSRSAPEEPARTRHTGRTIGRSLALGLLIFVTVVLVLFVVYNGQTVEINLVFTDVEAPLVLALVIAAVLGALVGWLTSLVLRSRRRHRS